MSTHTLVVALLVLVTLPLLACAPTEAELEGTVQARTREQVQATIDAISAVTPAATATATSTPTPTPTETPTPMTLAEYEQTVCPLWLVADEEPPFETYGEAADFLRGYVEQIDVGTPPAEVEVWHYGMLEIVRETVKAFEGWPDHEVFIPQRILTVPAAMDASQRLTEALNDGAYYPCDPP